MSEDEIISVDVWNWEPFVTPKWQRPYWWVRWHLVDRWR